MKSLLDLFRNNYKFIGTGVLFILAFAIIAMIIPRERRFHYEFHRLKPWTYDDYTAKFRFPIYKSNERLEAEKDSALKNVDPYFTYDTSVYTVKLEELEEGFPEYWKKYSINKYGIDSSKYYENKSRYKNLREYENKVLTFLKNELAAIYKKGILEQPANEEIVLHPFDEIIIVKNNLAIETNIDEIYTPKEAYKAISNKLEEFISQEKSRLLSKYDSFFQYFDINKYIKPNIYFNQEATEREKKARISEISLTNGFVQEGQLIISKGEIVTQEKYRILQSLEIEYENQLGNVGIQLVLIGRLLLVAMAMLLIYLFLYNFRLFILKDAIKSGFILFLMVSIIFTATTILKFENISVYIIPVCILPIILRTFYDERVAIFVHIFTVLILGLFIPDSFEFIFLNIMAGVVATFSLTNIYRRSKYFIAALLVFITYSITYFGMSVIQEGSFSEIHVDKFMFFGINGIFTLISFLLIYLFEKTFGFLSDTTLMELSDTNQPLLRKLSEVAPGTFQHSLQVASLSEEAIYSIGGNPLLVRTGALYHDIGKLYDPIYFIENQTEGINPHNNLEFEDSAKIIIDHVRKGIQLAKKHKLPEAIIDFIRTHHGTSTVQYFYRSYIKKYPEKEVDIQRFSYPGPKPYTKEMAVLMMADSVEAASRSLNDYTKDSIDSLVEKIIDFQLKERQFDDAPITFQDISTVKDLFKKRLKNIYHARISYPKE